MGFVRVRECVFERVAEPSHVLRAMGVPFTAVHGSVRLSFSAYTTEGGAEDCGGFSAGGGEFAEVVAVLGPEE